MASSNGHDEEQRVVPFPKRNPLPTEPSDKMHLDLAGLGICDDLTDELKRKSGNGSGEPPPKRRGASFWVVLALATLAAIAIWGHFHSLSLLETVRYNPDNLGYDELVTWHNSVARQMSNLKLLSNVSLAAIFGIILAWIVQYQTKKNT